MLASSGLAWRIWNSCDTKEKVCRSYRPLQAKTARIFQSSSQIDRVAHDRMIAAIAPADFSSDHQAGVDTDMETKFGPVSVIESNNPVHCDRVASAK
jgi:hypothetical protein